MKKLQYLFAFLFVSMSFFSAQAQHSHKKMMDAKPMMKNDVTVVYLNQNEGVYTTDHMELKPGKYIFAVKNNNVDKELGFYLTDTSEKPQQIPNSGLQHLVNNGESSMTGVVELKKGSYQYSCPLNPTPHYSLVVK